MRPIQKVEASEVIAKHLRKVLAEIEYNLAIERSDLAMERADLDLRKQKREVEVMAAKERLAKAK